LPGLWPVASRGIIPPAQRKLALAEARVSQVEAELRLILVEAQVSQLEARLSHLESELAEVRTQRDILIRPSNLALLGGTSP
jgi:hypothetical protein